MRISKVKSLIILIGQLFISLILMCSLVQNNEKVQAESTTDAYSISNLVTSGHAIGVASDFNIFATEKFVQQGQIHNARVGASLFNSPSYNSERQKIGWTSPSSDPNVDSHILVVGDLTTDESTRKITSLVTDQKTGVFAAETPNLSNILHNSNKELVTADPLSSVKDFSKTGIKNFAEAQQQIADISKFYQNDDRLKSTFSGSFMRISKVQRTDYVAGGGVTKKIDDLAISHELHIIDIDSKIISDTGGIKIQNGGILNINIQIKTNSTTPPIVVINLPNLTDTLDLNNLNDHISITYGESGTENTFSDREKRNILINLPAVKEIKLMNTFVGTFLAPQAEVRISSLNTSVSAIVARVISIDNSVSDALGADGVFNPDSFRDPDNSAENEIKNSVTATVTKNGDQAKDFSISNTELNNLKYNDILHFSLSWSGYTGASLYKLNDNGKWVKVDQGITTDSEGINKYNVDEDTKLNSKINSQNDGDFLIYTLTHPVNSYQYALFTEDPNVNYIKAEWQSGIVTTNFANFKLSIPFDLVFSEFKGVDSNGLLKFEPKNTSVISYDNQFNAPFKLSVQALRSSIEPNSNDNVFTNPVSKFNYVASDTEIQGLLDGSSNQPVIILDKPTLPVPNFNLSTFKLNIPAAMRFNKSKIIFDWKLSLGG